MKKQKTYKHGDLVTMEVAGKKQKLRIGSAIGNWLVNLWLPGVGACGLYKR